MMQKITKILLILFVVIGITIESSYAQRSPTKRPDKKYLAGEYYKALKLYEKVLKRKGKKKLKKNEKAEIAYKIASCYDYINDTRKAATQYTKAIKQGYNDPKIYLKLAEVQKTNEKLADALLNYGEYLKLVPGDSVALEGIRSCELAKEWTDNPTPYEIDVFKPVNSKYSDFCSSYDARKENNDIYFTSTREGVHSKMVNPVTGFYFSDIFMVQLDRKGEWSDPEPLDSLVNSIYDDGTPCINPKGNTMYFSRCVWEKKKHTGCQIYVSQKAGGYWGKAVKLEVLKNNDNDSITVAHPSISADETELYFVSEMKGGYGGNDIWKVVSKGGGWSDPINLGPEINSEMNEMYPFIRDDGALFFSTDRYPSMGGYDIYKAAKDSNNAWVVENMKYPINSVADDFGIIFQGSKEKGMFSSSRLNRRDNIFLFEIPPLSFKLKGAIKDLETGIGLDSAIIKLIGSDGTIFRDTSDEEGKFNYKLKPNTDYIYIVSRNGYLNYKGTVSTDSLERSRDFNSDIYLKPTRDPIELDNILYDFGRASLREESKLELNKLVEILNENPNIIIELAAHSDMVGQEKPNLVLSQERADTVVHFLILKGVPPERLVAKGYGESKPKVVGKSHAAKYPFLKEGDVLDELFIMKLEADQKDIANQINRRTEFQVLPGKYIPKSD